MEFWRSKKGKAKKRFLRNGRRFLEELIKDCNGMSNPIRMFSSAQILKATDHFSAKCYLSEVGFYTWYKGEIEDRPYAIKKCTGLDFPAYYDDIALSARVSSHSGFLKLIGCSLEFPLPVLVFENTEFFGLNARASVGSYDGPLLPWSVRLKIAKEVAIAVTYLHTAFPRIIIHRDIKPTNVFLDKNCKAKLTDFSLAITLPEGKTWLEDKQLYGTLGYLDPNYYCTNLVTEYTDVFSFGIFMLVLFTGRPAYSHDLEDIFFLLTYVKDLHKKGETVEFGGDSDDMRPDQMNKFLELALRCCKEENQDRPKMIQVAKELKRIGLMEQSLDAIELIEQPVDQSEADACMALAPRCCKEVDERRPKMINVAKELRRSQQIEKSVDDTFGLLKPEMLENGSSVIKWIRKFGFKIEVMLILSLCIAGLFIALLFG